MVAEARAELGDAIKAEGVESDVEPNWDQVGLLVLAEEEDEGVAEVRHAELESSYRERMAMKISHIMK